MLLYIAALFLLNMISDKSQAMGFAEFCKRLNDDPEYMRRYRKDPGGLIEEDLKIALSELQKDELKKTVDAIFASIPNARFYIAGEKLAPPSPEPEPRPVPH
jgi:hypothetical protein